MGPKRRMKWKGWPSGNPSDRRTCHDRKAKVARDLRSSSVRSAPNADNTSMQLRLIETFDERTVPRGEGEFIMDAQHQRRVVLEGILKSRISLDTATADFKAMLV